MTQYVAPPFYISPFFPTPHQTFSTPAPCPALPSDDKGSVQPPGPCKTTASDAPARQWEFAVARTPLSWRCPECQRQTSPVAPESPATSPASPCFSPRFPSTPPPRPARIPPAP